LSFQVISLVYDSSEPPLEYQLLSLINSGVCVIIFIWLLANCSEEKCKEFLMAQKEKGIDCVLLLVLIIRAVLASFLLVLYVNTNGNFTQKTTFLIASIAGFISVILLIIIITDSCRSQKTTRNLGPVALANIANTGNLMKPYFRNHLGNIKNAASYNYKITPRGARFKR
tara:strand:+ start:814 stop:1323 length:510 start_codon:yes stop_codon:yes gene_type:complete